ncbi:MAG: peptide ABC transporter substrate-binding protein, partial [Caldilineaceae bacterium]|nr:peptide ABC transporter substrate-binding protein [Caldilineaceae bacterium]
MMLTRATKFIPILSLLLITTLLLTACPTAAPSSGSTTTEETADSDTTAPASTSGIGDRDPKTLNILYWQAVSILNPYLSSGTKDYDAGSLILEPLGSYNQDGVLVPTLAAEIPTLENGGIAEDLMSITWKLKEDVVWSDGTPFTAEDVAFTWLYCTTPETGCSSTSSYEDVANVEALDELTVLVTFGAPKPFPYGPFTSSASPIIQKAQFAACVGAAAQGCAEQNT